MLLVAGSTQKFSPAGIRTVRFEPAADDALAALTAAAIAAPFLLAAARLSTPETAPKDTMLCCAEIPDKESNRAASLAVATMAKTKFRTGQHTPSSPGAAADLKKTEDL